MSLQSIHAQIAERPLRPLQILVIAMGTLINMVDGLDLLAASLVSPILTREWNLAPGTLGILLSAGPLGTAAGALLLSAVADVYGRRNAILVNLGLMSIGMLLSATADSVLQLTVLRFLTGMGVGAMASCVGTLVFEYCSRRTRSLGLGFVTIGYNVGVVIGGILASQWLIEAYGWRSLFLFGGLVSAALIPLVMLLLPESLDYLVAHPRRGTLTRLNRILTRLDLPAFDALPAPSRAVLRSSPLDLLRQPILPRLLLMQLAYFLYMMSSYFFLNWNNQLTTEAGFSDERGAPHLDPDERRRNRRRHPDRADHVPPAVQAGRDRDAHRNELRDRRVRLRRRKLSAYGREFDGDRLRHLRRRGSAVCDRRRHLPGARSRHRHGTVDERGSPRLVHRPIGSGLPARGRGRTLVDMRGARHSGAPQRGRAGTRAADTVAGGGLISISPGPSRPRSGPC